MSKQLDGAEVAKHNGKDSLWVIIHGKAWDLTEFAPEHPGGAGILYKYGGKDATEAYEPIHPPNTLETNLSPDKMVGEVKQDTIQVVEETKKDKPKLQPGQLPPLDQCLNLYDFEVVARQLLKPTAWAYYSSGADDEVTMRENSNAYGRVWFRPRILRDVSSVNFATSMLGQKTSMPIYITATALGRLGHPDGEKNLTVAAGKSGLIQMIPTLASCSFDEIVDAKVHDQQVQFFQLYVNSNRAITEKIVRHAENRGVKGLFVTVDAPQLGRREKDMRMKFDDTGSQVQNSNKDNVDRSQGAARAISSFIDPSLNWEDLQWLRSITKMPIVLKGVQTWEDAVLAAEAGLNGVVLSNHGGRQLDYAPSGIEILAEVVAALKQRNLWRSTFEVFIDGGVRRATDVLKAVALGAKGVGIGRPFLYAYSAYGAEGTLAAINILKAEMEMAMRLLGARTIAEITPDMVDTRALGFHSSSVPASHGRSLYERLDTAVGGADEGNIPGGLQNAGQDPANSKL